MTAKKISVILATALALTISAMAGTAGTLENAPFQIALPDGSWTLHDSTAKDMGKNVYLVASITSTNTQSKSIIRSDIDPPSASALDDLCDGMRDQFSDPSVKKLYDAPATFLGYKARRFIFEVNGSTYSEAIVFVTANTGWTIDCVGLFDQKTEVNRLLTFYRSK
jgi:hypothetical protein